MELTKDFKEYCPEEVLNPPEEVTEEAEELEPHFGSRKQYLDTLTEYGAALYMAQAMRDMKMMTYQTLLRADFWEKWFETEVDDNGEEIEIVE